MPDALYEDDKCHYLSGDPRFEPVPWGRHGALRVTAEALEFEFDDEEVEKRLWPRSAIEEIYYEVVPQLVDGEGPFDFPAACVVVRDPEGAFADGFHVRFQFRNEYYARVFIKYACQTFGLQAADGSAGSCP